MQESRLAQDLINLFVPCLLPRTQASSCLADKVDTVVAVDIGDDLSRARSPVRGGETSGNSWFTDFPSGAEHVWTTDRVLSLEHKAMCSVNIPSPISETLLLNQCTPYILSCVRCNDGRGEQHNNYVPRAGAAECSGREEG